MSTQLNFDIVKVHLNTFAVNNVAAEASQISMFPYDITYREQISTHENSIGITILVNIYLDEQRTNRVGAIETRCDYRIFDFNRIIKNGELEEQFFATLIEVSLSTTRGMLIAKSAGTLLSKFVLPVLSPVELVQTLRKVRSIEDLFIAGNNYYDLENYAKAIESYSEILKLEGDNLDALYNLALSYAELEQYREALIYIDKVIELESHNATNYAFRAKLYLLMNNLAIAMENVEKALQLDTSSGVAYAVLAGIYAQQSKDELFYQALENALKYGLQPQQLDEEDFLHYQEEPRFRQLLQKYSQN